jgi:hypothetical protein
MSLDNIYERAKQRYGQDIQIIVAIEEMAELVRVLTKILRSTYDHEKLCEEVADVELMLEQLKVMFSIEPDVEKWKRHKLRRLERILDERPITEYTKKRV